MQPVPALGKANLEVAGAGCAGAKRRPGRVHQPEHEVAARLADDRGIERRIERHEARFHELAERCCSDRERIRERRHTDELHARGHGPDLQLPIWIGQAPDNVEQRPAGRRAAGGEPDEDGAAVVGDDTERGQPDATRLGGDDAPNVDRGPDRCATCSRDGHRIAARRR